MSSETVRILFIGDVVADPGVALIETFLSSFKNKYKADFVIVNGENAHEGMGLNEEIVKTIYSNGANVITGGNHSFAKWKIFNYMKSDSNLLRPLNYPRGAHGFGYGIYDIPGKNLKIGVVNMMGRTYMQPLDCPFKTSDWILEKIKAETNIIFIDFHAEATAEKMSFGWYNDGMASVIVGTHTHIPTNDCRILPKGTGYITDVGMTGSYNSVIGMDKDVALKRFTLQTPHRYSPANGDNKMAGVVADIDVETGKCVHIESFIYPNFKTEVSS